MYVRAFLQQCGTYFSPTPARWRYSASRLHG